MMMRRGRHGVRAALCVLLCAVLFLLCGCRGQGAQVRYFGYLDEPLSLALSGKLDGMAFRALLESEGRQTATGHLVEGAADFTLTFLSPEALAGVSVRCEEGVLTVALEGLSDTGEAYEALGWVGSLLTTESAVHSSSNQTWTAPDGSTVQAIEAITADGARRWIDAKTGRPLGLTLTADGRSLEVTVESGR